MAVGSSRSLLSLGGFVRLADLADLAGVRFGVGGTLFQQLAERDAASLGVIAGAVVRALGQRLQQVVVLGARAAQRFERLFRLAARVVQMAGPGVLIDPDHGRRVLRDHLAEDSPTMV